MIECDTVVIAGLRCKVAEEAQRAWHSFIKNGFLFHTDRVLADWIRDEVTMREFEECVRDVCQSMRGFSGGQLVSDLRPLQALDGEEQRQLKGALDHAFDRAFGPDKLAHRVGDRLDHLMGLARNFGSPETDPDEAKQRLAEIRGAAQALWRELEKLPRGFWLPRRALNTVKVAGT